MTLLNLGFDLNSAEDDKYEFVIVIAKGEIQFQEIRK